MLGDALWAILTGTRRLSVGTDEGLASSSPGASEAFRRGLRRVWRRADRHQTTATLEALKHALESAGSSLDKVVKTTVYISNAAYFPTVNRIYARYFPDQPPARTFVAVGSWPLEFDIEIECIALA